MSLECAECEHDLRGGHADNCSRHPSNRKKLEDDVNAELKKRIAENRKAVKEVEACLRADRPHPKARWFVWKDGLYYGWAKSKAKGFLLGTFTQVAEVDFGEEAKSKRAFKIIAKVMNERDEQRKSAINPEK